MDYGSGAVFGCPAHDQRDLDFAKKYNLDVIPVILPEGHNNKNYKINNEAFVGNGILINSSFLNGKTIDEAKKIVIDNLIKKNLGNKKINYNNKTTFMRKCSNFGCFFLVL